MGLHFTTLRTQNLQRCIEFRDAQGNLCHPHGVLDWSLPEWSNAMAGEAGEACNITKKIRRGDFEGREHEARDMLADEIADVIIYADLLAAAAGIDLGEAVRRKFNRTSDKVQSGVKL